MKSIMENESKYARNLIETTLDPLIAIDTNGIITDVNQAMMKATDKNREELIGTNLITYFVDPEKARKVYKEIFIKGHVMNSPLTIIDGIFTDVLLNGSVYKDEQANVLGAVIVARDITELKKVENELMEAKSRAEVATGIAEDATKAKQQFLSNMSHEIRTPMNAIIGFTKVALKTDLTDKQQEYLTAIKESGDTLIILINDILDLAKVDAGKMTFEKIPFKMAKSITAMLHLFETKIQENNVVLVKEYDNKIPGILIGDSVRLHQIILNLVSNAVKFTTKGKITVRVHLLKEDEDKVTIEFSIADTGIGIPENSIAHIFENFKQASNGTSRLYGGTGLGLAISKQLVESQGGKINVKSKIDEGSTFSFTLDFLKSNGDIKIEDDKAALDTEPKNIRVLVAEDIALNQLLMKTVLGDLGFEYDVASNGKIAIEKLKTGIFDIILMDLQMPEMNGFEATEFIRNKMNSKIPIIALTADVTTVDVTKCKSVGMNDYISKPVDEKLLFSKIIELVKKPRPIESANTNEKMENQGKKPKFINLSRLNQSTKSDPKLMMEFISAYLHQTPPLINIIKQSLQEKDWNSLQEAVHKMIPSFSIMGISKEFENMAKSVQEHTNKIQLNAQGIPALVIQLEKVCAQACTELEDEFKRIENANHVHRSN
jgi:PAS domain S-box-containing protein